MTATFRTPQDWHAWFGLQAEWTRSTRLWLYAQAGLGQARSVLEVGCGTGVIAAELTRLCRAAVVGLDIDADMLAVARHSAGDVALVQGDAHALPFAAGRFDIVLCHYLLLWLAAAGQAVSEMVRVARPGGAVLACAEPDYGGRIDHPPELAHLGQLQAQSLRRQGAHPETGRRLGELFAAAGLRATVGLMAGQWTVPTPTDAAFDAEWAVRRHDLAALLSADDLDRLQQTDREALASGQRVLFVPTFYAWGKRT